ncbi:deoxyribose-phosphate aldolase [Verruconis gallopava]|uniref:deoxyribose-phosphate aldolase n=1 Tax=Verruconis gallopava TaxID=253628 RepID=A0A0D1XXY5_9PEZI|nr:deoxyribose-phosphate aldolase [Verruconis gallopava]KIW07661.1 deoxyribose-phosphate aldolase [Verruconis gallopava]
MSTDEFWKSKIAEVSSTLERADPKPAISCHDLTASALASTIDHTLLRPDATRDQVAELCDEAVRYGFAAVCVRVDFVALAVARLQDAPATKVACVVGFHEGTHATAAKVAEAQAAVAAGAAELDVVLNRETVQAGTLASAHEELKALRSAAPPPVVLKLILETSQLSRDEVIAATVIAGYAGFDFVKTSTGFCGRGASVEDVLLMNRVATALSQRDDLGEFKGVKMKVKASGGVRSLEDAKKMLDAGAERIGTSGGIRIMKDYLGEGSSEPAGSGY